MKKLVSVLALATLLATLATLPNRGQGFAAEGVVKSPIGVAPDRYLYYPPTEEPAKGEIGSAWGTEPDTLARSTKYDSVINFETAPYDQNNNFRSSDEAEEGPKIIGRSDVSSSTGRFIERWLKDEALLDQRQIAQGAANPNAKGSAPDLAAANKEFANPLTSATMLIMENDTVFLGGKLDSGTRVANITVFEPIIPVPLGNTGWTLVNRPILPIAINAPIPVAGSGGGAAEGGTFSFKNSDGFGDFTFFSLLAPPMKGKFKFGFGPTFQFPTASRDELGSEKFSVGPAAVGLYSSNKFTIGMLTQSWFSVAGDDDRKDVSKSTFQYFWFYNFTPQWGIGAAPIVSVNWNADDDDDKVAFPVGLGVTHTFKLGKYPARLFLEGQYYAIRRDSYGPEWNIRLALGVFLPPLFGK